MSKLFSLTFLVLASVSIPSYSAVEDCGELKNYGDIGPWDYSDPSSSASTGADPMGRIKRVENVHFNSDVRSLNRKRYSIDQLTAEIHYTLRMFPNHTEALVSISRLEKMAGGKLPQNTATIYTPRLSAYCFFDRAIRFKENDKNVRFAYAIHLHQNGKFKEALEQYLLAEPQWEDNRYFQYNLGLLYADMKNWEKAVDYAQRAYGSGVSFPSLRQKIEKSGYKINIPPPHRSDAHVGAGDPTSSKDN
ncbi:tetratricopeptide repeat protein [Dechloromonas hortensis]|uniref:tetratricopeptide repeat protein n=1 Tax=Dechloromonas hortensis TaxID=337779 RepID=UPI001291D1EF|nr:tetratricopeptide repeat protein [Dechloromonas hortensis]